MFRRPVFLTAVFQHSAGSNRQQQGDNALNPALRGGRVRAGLGKGIAFPNRGGATGCALCAERVCGNGMPSEAGAFRRYCDVWGAGPVQIRIS
ncbi:hypothetical protein C1M26_07845 [Neisseria gonorrhoeae]